MSKINILFFTTSLGGGGAEMQLLRLLNNLDLAKFKITLALSRPGGSYEKMLNEHINIKHLKTGKLSSNTYRLVRSVIPLRKYIQKIEPDIVCSVMDHANVAAMNAIEKLEKKPATVLCVQNNPVFKYEKKVGLVNKAVYQRMKKYYPKADKIIPLTHGVAGELKRMIDSIEKENITVIHNAGYDVSVIDKAKKTIGKPVDKPLLVACGRLIEQKGYSHLLKAAAIVAKNYDFKLLILGKGPLLTVLQEQKKELGLNEKVEFLGFRDNPYKYMAAADIFVLSSLWEGFGNVVVEAMACGTAVVSTDCPYGPGEIIAHEQSGLLVDVADEQALANAIICLIKDHDLRYQIAKKGQERARTFEASVVAEQYAQLFCDLSDQP